MGGGPQRSTANQYLTHCKRCNEAVYKFQLWIFRNGERPGIVHTDCTTKPEKP